MNIPILFICYKRHKYIESTFKKILEFKPNKLYISIDAPKNSEDFLDVIEVKKTIEKLLNDNSFDFSNLYYKIEEKNLGCDLNVINSINWVFDKNEDELIIIEEDVLITDEFINFIINYKNKVINNEYICISKPLFETSDIFQFNAHGWYITKDNWINTFNMINIINNVEVFENIIRYVYRPSPDAYKAIKYTLQQRRFNWDENFKYNIFLQNKKVLYAPLNSTKHIGDISTNKEDVFILNDKNEIVLKQNIIPLT